MATFFSSLVQGASNSTFSGVPSSSTSGPSHARTRTSYATFDGAPASGDIMVIDFFKSSDQPIDIRFSTDGGGTAGAIDIGLYAADFRNNSLELTAVDVDLFASAFSTTSGVFYTTAASLFFESGTLDDVMDRGKALWELAAIGAASYTSDPGLTFALAATVTTTIDAANEMSFDVTYVAGD